MDLYFLGHFFEIGALVLHSYIDQGIKIALLAN